MAGLFRRFRRPKDAAPEEGAGVEEAPAEGSDLVPAEEVAPTGAPDVAAPVPEAAAVAPAPASASSAAGPEPAATSVTSGPPPPLPKPDESGAGRSVPGGPGTYRSCFLCGSAMDGPWCPTCRMVWND